MLMEPRLPKLREVSDKTPTPALLHCTVKRDGWQVRVCKDRFGQVFYWSRKPKEVDLSWHGIHQHGVLDMPLETQVVGELYWPGHEACDVPTAIKAQDISLRFEAYAVEYERGAPVWMTQPPEDTAMWLRGHGFCTPPKVTFDPRTESLTPDVEGYVLKESALAGWWKWKPRRTMDLVVTGFKDGKGKHAGLIGSLVTDLANVGGFTDEERLEMSRGGWKRHVGRVIEVEYQLQFPDGRLRHPRFVRWRDDL